VDDGIYENMVSEREFGELLKSMEGGKDVLT
jgi:hypothetical protein